MKAIRFSLFSAEGSFTFVEVFAAMVFLAILVPAIVQGLSIANQASVVTERTSVAGELAENKLNELLLSSTGTTASAASNKGDFGTDWPGYRWESSQATWTGDTVNTVTELDVDVYFPVQGKERSVRLSTITSGTNQEQSSP